MKKLFLILSSVLFLSWFTSAEPITQFEEIESMASELENKLATKYPLFYEDCIFPEWNEESQLIYEDHPTDYINNQWCHNKYQKELTIVNNLLIKLFWTQDGGDIEDITLEEIQNAYSLTTALIDVLDTARTKALNSNKLPPQMDIMFSAIIYYLEMAKLWLNVLML